MDRRRIDRPATVSAPQEQAGERDPNGVILRLRQRAAWLRLQTLICVVLLAVLMAGGGVVFSTR